MTSVLDVGHMKKLIKDKFGSQNAFARELHVSRQYIHQILSGELDPSIERLVEFADKLEVSVDELLGKELALVA